MPFNPRSFAFFHLPSHHFAFFRTCLGVPLVFGGRRRRAMIGGASRVGGRRAQNKTDGGAGKAQGTGWRIVGCP